MKGFLKLAAFLWIASLTLLAGAYYFNPERCAELIRSLW